MKKESVDKDRIEGLFCVIENVLVILLIDLVLYWFFIEYFVVRKED